MQKENYIMQYGNFLMTIMPCRTALLVASPNFKTKCDDTYPYCFHDFAIAINFVRLSSKLCAMENFKVSLVFLKTIFYFSYA